MKSVVAFCFLVALTGAVQAQESSEQGTVIHWNADNLQSEKECLLKIVRKKMGVTDVAPSPRLRIESQTPLIEFQDAMDKWWGFRPDVFLNVFDAPMNTVYLMTNMKYYSAPRTPVDSLVHELTHFVQVKDLGKDAGGDGDQLESEAVQIQTWFRDNYSQHIIDEKYTGPCE